MTSLVNNARRGHYTGARTGNSREVNAFWTLQGYTHLAPFIPNACHGVAVSLTQFSMKSRTVMISHAFFLQRSKMKSYYVNESNLIIFLPRTVR